MSNNATQLRRTAYQVTWATSPTPTDFGFVDAVDPALDLKLDPITTGTTGKLILGWRVVGLEGTIKMQMRQTTLANFKVVMPWYVSGSVPLVPPTPNVDLYTYAAQLQLHPVDLAAATVTEDVYMLKAVPMQSFKLKRDGKGDDIYEVSWGFFPDRTKLALDPPQVVYGYIGTPP